MAAAARGLQHRLLQHLPAGGPAGVSGEEGDCSAQLWPTRCSPPLNQVASVVGLTAQRRGRHPCLQDCTGRLVARLDQAAEAGEVVKMHELAILTTLEVICQVGRKVLKRSGHCRKARLLGAWAELRKLRGCRSMQLELHGCAEALSCPGIPSAALPNHVQFGFGERVNLLLLTTLPLACNRPDQAWALLQTSNTSKLSAGWLWRARQLAAGRRAPQPAVDQL